MWTKDLFGVEKPIIAMCHMQAMPGDPGYDYDGGMEKVYEMARADLKALQEGASILRVHDVAEAARTIEVFWRLC